MLRKEYCKQGRYFKFKGTRTKWTVQKPTNRTTRKHVENFCFCFFVFLFSFLFIIFFFYFYSWFPKSLSIDCCTQSEKLSNCSPCISVKETSIFVFKFLYCFKKNISVIKLLVSRIPLHNSIFWLWRVNAAWCRIYTKSLFLEICNKTTTMY